MTAEPDGHPPRRLDRRPPALVQALLVAAVGVLATVALGGLFSVTAGLLAVAGLLGWGVGATVRGSGSIGRRTTLAVLIAVGSVAAEQLALWWWAGLEGGRLAVIDYLAQAYGLLVPAQLVIAAAAAAWASR